MRTNLSTRNSIAIDAPASEVWQAMTTAELIKQWFFGVDTFTDWEVGSPIVHRGMWQDRPYEDKGEIRKIEPPHLLIHSHWSALSGVPDSPENYQDVAWELESDGSTILTISEVNLPSEEAKAVSEKSWDLVLNNLKTLLEG